MVLSDTEAELGTAQHKERVKKSDDVTWKWGELPQVTHIHMNFLMNHYLSFTIFLQDLSTVIWCIYVT